jgi:hypothetical protein
MELRVALKDRRGRLLGHTEVKVISSTTPLPEVLVYGLRVFVFASATRREYREATVRVLKRPLDEVEVLRERVVKAIAGEQRTNAH